MNERFVEETWATLGKRVRPLNRTVFVRTIPFEQKIGSIWLPPKLSRFHGELPHLRQIEAVVLAAGPGALKRGITVGERIVFQRLHFASWINFSDLDRVGWIDASQVIGLSAEEQAA